MTIILAGGGTGGHITPLLAVAHELKAQDNTLRLAYVGEWGGKFAHLSHDTQDLDKIYSVSAGKFRRYNGRSRLENLLDIKTLLLNIRDAFLVLFGLIESIFLLLYLQPDCVFIKGGFVGVPIGLAAALLHIPFVTHDSDSLPGLANRIIARWARVHAVGMPKEFYTYPADKTVYVGIPLAPQYVPVTHALQNEYRTHLGISTDALVMSIVGGSLGAVRMNNAVVAVAPKLLQAYPTLVLLHQTGTGNTGLYSTLPAEYKTRVIEREFVDNLYEFTGSADVVMTRAGATSLAELATQGRACIIVPSPYLTGGHQLKNAQELAAKHAVVVVQENEIEANREVLLQTAGDLLDNKHKREQLSLNIEKLAMPHAAKELATLLLTIHATKKTKTI